MGRSPNKCYRVEYRGQSYAKHWGKAGCMAQTSSDLRGHGNLLQVKSWSGRLTWPKGKVAACARILGQEGDWIKELTGGHMLGFEK